MHRTPASAALLLACALAVSGCSGAKPSEPDGGAGGSGGGGDAAATALRAVDTLTVKGRAPKKGYSRDEFGKGWLDTNANECTTRDDVLRRDLVNTRFKGDGCRVTSGVLKKDPYGGKRLKFERGDSNVDIDHVVALSDAWQKGAGKWDRAKRIAFANDPLNLLAVSASANRRKGDGDAASWLPANRAFRCPYVATQVAVKKKYELWVTAAERDAMRRVLEDCRAQTLPSGGTPTRPPGKYR
ncbi:HNH endonuclease family protein [Streptomyces sp. NPDC086023]|uniref:HNH endonuclease family protein n=1 Tax=Streptomyces sp. NPDC086023 TaxID=3365746 RepID=UPI0037D61CDB